MSQSYGAVDDEGIDPHDPARASSTLASACSITADAYGKGRERDARRSSHSRNAEAKSCWPRSSAWFPTRAAARRRDVDARTPAREGVVRGQPAAPRGRGHRSVLSPPDRSGKSAVEETVGGPWASSCARGPRCASLACRKPAPTAFAARTGTHPTRGAAKRVFVVDPRAGTDGPFPVCRELGIGFVAFSPPRPRLPDRYGHGPPTGLASNDVRRQLPRFQKENLEKKPRAGRRARGARAGPKNCSTPQLAVGRGCWRRVGTLVPIPGTETAALRRREHRRPRTSRLTPADVRDAGRSLSDRHRRGSALPARQHAPARDRAGALTG